MELTKINIVNRINKLLVTYKTTWDDIVDDLDMAIDEINNYMSTKYPPVSKVLHKYAPAETTYSYRAAGVDVPFFSERFFHSIVIPYVVTRILTVDEEFTTVYSIYLNQYQENLFVMARDEMSSIPAHLFSAPRGVYFANPNPVFKADPEGYFNAQIFMDVPKLKVSYSWGDIKLGTQGISSFVSKPLPIDNNSYEIGSLIVPVIMQDTNFNTFIVDSKGNVLGTFLGWSLVESGETRPIINGAITLEEDLKFFAVFDYDIVRFRYLGNGGTLQNWKPIYINGGENPVDVVPFGGTAIRPGHKFIGFDPDIITAQEIFDRDELDDINDYHEEQELTFTAQWNLVFYILTFIAQSQPILGRSGYVYGDEFDLVPPKPTPASTDEFIGWWDNILFQGDPVTKIYESDYGDKIFYAKYNEETFMITWQKDDGSPIRQEPLVKNTLLNPPTVPEEYEYMNQNDGLWYIREFQGFVNEAGDSPNKAIKNDTFTATYAIVRITRALQVQHNINNAGTIEASTLLLTYQVGQIISKNEIISLLGDKRKYTDALSTVWYTSDISGESINGVSISGSTFVMAKDGLLGMSVYTKYTESVINIIFRRQVIDPANAANTIIVDALTYQHPEYLPDGSDKELIYGLALIGENDILPIIGTTTTVYLDGFKSLINDVLHDLTDVIIQTEPPATLVLVPVYSAIKNTEFVKELTIIGMPQETTAVTTTEIIEVGLNETINLISGKPFSKNNVNANDDFLFLTIEGFYLTKIGNVYSNPITEIKTFSNVTIYAKTQSKKVFSVFANGELMLDVFPYQIVNGKIFDASNYETELTPVHPTDPVNYKFIGWNPLQGQTVVDNYVSVANNHTVDVNYYPVFVQKFGYKINLLFTSNYVATETDFTRGLSISFNIGPEFENTSKQVFSSYNDVTNLVNSVSNGSKTPQQSGYEFYSWKQGSAGQHQAFPVFINLPEAAEQIQEINLTFELKRRSGYFIVTVSNFMTILDPTIEASMVVLDHYQIQETWNLKKFIAPIGQPYITQPDLGGGWILGTPTLVHTGSLGGVAEQIGGTVVGTYYYLSSLNGLKISSSTYLTSDRTIYLAWESANYA